MGVLPLVISSLLLGDFGSTGIIPNPVSTVPKAGSIHVSRNSQLGFTPMKLLEPVVDWLNSIPSSRRNGAPVRFQLDSTLPKEGYKLSITMHGVTARCGDSAGAFHALQSLIQLSNHGVLHCQEITDSPRFGWRGMHLDESRHFFGVSEVKKYIDWLARYKFNIFHWHLVDDGGWRIEIKKYPKLTEVGAWRKANDWSEPLSFVKPGYGGFYTQEQIREIVRYASDRFITVVPEIEMPGHSSPVFVAYPELRCEGQPPNNDPTTTNTNVYCAGKEATFEFLHEVLDETMALFPSKFIHIGGDEVDKQFWQRCPQCQARMKSEGLSNVNELQSYFVQRMERYLNSKGRRLIGWDEILEGGLAENATVMSWRGISGGIAAAKAGHDVVMSPTSHCYFDYPYNSISTEHVYGFDPVPAELSATEAKHILGGQANVWTEWIPTPARMQHMVLPRMIALSEALWTTPSKKDYKSFSQRLESQYSWMNANGLNYYVAPPEVESTAVLFTDRGTFKAPSKHGAFTLRYELGDGPVTAKSKVFPGSFTTASNQKITVAYVGGPNQVGDSVSIEFVKFTPTPIRHEKPGIQTFLITDFKGSVCPKPEDFGGTRTWIQDYIGISFTSPDEEFALMQDGSLNVETEGLYTFYLTSDDGSRLWVGGAEVVNHDGLHGAITKTGRIRLKPGRYPIRVIFFEKGGAQVLNLKWQLDSGPVKPLGRTDLELGF